MQNGLPCITVNARTMCIHWFMCMISVSGLYLHPLRYVINIAWLACMILCFKLRGRTYTRTDVYENYDCAVSAQEYYMHGLMRIGKS